MLVRHTHLTEVNDILSFQVVVKLAGENEHTPYFPVSYVVRDVRESQTCNNQQILTGVYLLSVL